MKYILPTIAIFYLMLPSIYGQTVTPGQNLESTIKSASGGDVILVESGTYSPLELNGLLFSETRPLVIKAKPGANVVVDGTNANRALYLTNSKYVVFEGIHFRKSLYEGVLIERSEHVIVRNCEVSQSGQAGIKVALGSSYVDILKTKIHDTGSNGPGNRRYGEGIYIGRGGSHTNANWPDLTKNVWIEGCEIYRCGAAEGIDVKGGAFANTIRNNTVHDITLGDPNFGQTNEAAVSLGHYAVYNGNIYQKNKRRENWVENNTIYKVRAGANNRISGIYSAGLGNNIKNNSVRDVKTTSINRNQNVYGLQLNNWGEAFLPVYVHNNTISNVGKNTNYRGLAITQNPGGNPNKKQDWYPNGQNTFDDDIIAVSAPNQVRQGQEVSVRIDYSASGDRDVIVTFQKDSGDYKYYTGAVRKVVKGSGTLWVKLTIPNNVPVADNAYQFQTYITDRNGDWRGAKDNIEKQNRDVLPKSTDNDRIDRISAASSVRAGTSFAVTIGYQTSANRDLHLSFKKGSTVYDTQKVRLTKGSGSHTFTINVPSNASPQNGYYLFSYLVKPNEGWSKDRYDAKTKNNISVQNNPNSCKITIRAKGSVGSEEMVLAINYDWVKRWTGIGTSWNNFSFEVNPNIDLNNIKVRFVNAKSQEALSVDKIVLGGNTLNTEVKATRSGNGSGERLVGGGYFDFGSGTCSSSARLMAGLTEEMVSVDSKVFSVLHNPLRSKQLHLLGPDSYRVVIFDFSGRQVFMARSLQGEHKLNLKSLNSGIYIVQMTDVDTGRSKIQKVIVP